MKNKIYKIIVCLLCVSMFTALIPNVSFAEVTDDGVYVEFYAPRDGACADFYTYVQNEYSERYYVRSMVNSDNFIEGVRIYDLTMKKYLDKEDIVTSEHQYRVDIWIALRDGYSFPDYQGKPNVNAYIMSHELTGVIKRKADIAWATNDKTSVIMSYVYVVNEREVIDSVKIDVTAPLAGEYPSYNYKLYTENINVNRNYDDNEYCINGITWYATAPSWNPVLLINPLNKDAVFEGGKTYRLAIELVAIQDAANGIEREFDFESSPQEINQNLIINEDYARGKESRYLPTSSTYTKDTYIIYKDYYCPYRNIIDNVSLEIDPPMLGEHPDFNPAMGADNYKIVENPDDLGFINGIKWHNNTSGKNLTEDDIFEPDNSYSFCTYLEPIDTETIFAVNNLGVTIVTGTLNGNVADISSGIVVNPNDSYAISFEYRFETLSNEITRVAVLELDEPVIGNTPDYDVYIKNISLYDLNRSGDNGNSVINGITWVNNTENRNMECTDTFKVGNDYSVYVDIKVNEPYTLGSSTTGVINDFEAFTIGIAGTNYYRLIYDFGEIEPYKATEGAASGISNPIEGEKPDFVMDLLTDECTVGNIRWYDNSARKYITNQDSFIGGHRYQIEFDIIPAENYEFMTNLTGEVTYTFMLDGQAVLCSGTKNKITAIYEFEPVNIRVCNLSVDAPVAGYSPTFIAYPDNDACTTNAIRWYDKTEDVYITENNDYTFEQGHVYVAIVDVFTLDNVYFESDENYLKATINEEFAEISPVFVEHEGTNVITIYSLAVAMRLSYEFKPCEAENVLDIRFDSYTGEVSVSHEINPLYDIEELSVYIAFYDKEERLISIAIKNVKWASDIYSEIVPENAEKCKAMLWNKNTLMPLCKNAECSVIIFE